MLNNRLDLDECTRLERLCCADRLDAGQAARLLDLRAIALASRSSARAAVTSQTEAVVFRAGRDVFAVSSRAVEQVRELGKIAPLPLAPAIVAGVIVHRAELVAALDLAQLFEGQPCSRSTTARLIVIERERHQIALLSDELIGVRSLDRDGLTAAPSTFPIELTQYVEGITPDGVTLLSIKSLMSHLLPAQGLR